jgi:predicted SAM-dependent methyltransferase
VLRTKRYIWIVAAGVCGVALCYLIAEQCRWSVIPRMKIRQYLSSHTVRKLQIGAGGYDPAGWLNTDIEPASGEAFLDASKAFPIPDQSLSYVFSEHVFEHLTYDEGLVMLRECYRTLRPGGRIRLATPNLLKLVQLFQETKTDAVRSYMSDKIKAHGWPKEPTPECFILNLELRTWGHKFVYDPATLIGSLKRAGFQAIAEFAPGESDDPQLAGIDLRHRTFRSVNDYETMVFQAIRP